MSVRIITTCTDRKRVNVDEWLLASTLSHGTMVELAAEWLSRVNKATDRQVASKVYGGRSFQEAMAAAAAVGNDLAIISAGLGLVLASQPVPGYGLTLVQGADDEIAKRCTGTFDAAVWWSLVNGQNPFPITQLVRSEGSGLVVIGLTSTYARLVERDLLALTESERTRLRIIGLSIDRELPPSLRAFVLPYDSRLDGPNSNVRGTRSDFASRAIRHFVEGILPKDGAGEIERHKAAVSEALAGWKPPQNVQRKKHSDEEIVALIRARLNQVGRNSTRMLRHLRDVEVIACEQTRFKNLFKRAIAEASS